MHSSWLKGHKDKEARLKQIQSAGWAFDLLKEILERDFRKKENVREYGDPQWVHKQMAVNEYNQALDDLLKIITLDKE
jgi:hypothetical protein|tara:strand:+ start:1089 stop:1322 length:234 start_codon:yes stop_codon:yes gene_type:complete